MPPRVTSPAALDFCPACRADGAAAWHLARSNEGALLGPPEVYAESLHRRRETSVVAEVAGEPVGFVIARCEGEAIVVEQLVLAEGVAHAAHALALIHALSRRPACALARETVLEDQAPRKHAA